MLKAKLDSVRKNKKGFSLVELIIVIAIMVALIAVMAPNFVKYVQKSRDTALQTAAEDFLSSVKVAYGDPDSSYKLPDASNTFKILIKVKIFSINRYCNVFNTFKEFFIRIICYYKVFKFYFILIYRIDFIT